MALSVFVEGARIVFAQYLMQQPLFFAVGSGDPAWDSLPDPTPDEENQRLSELAKENALESCIGVTRVRARSFMKADPNGEIVLSDGSRWSVSSTATNTLRLEGRLDIADATGNSIRETGVYLDTQLSEAVPSGQMFIPIGDVVSLGTLIQLHRFPPIVRDGTISQALNPYLEL
ncbi:hypothetical protein CQ054_05835 [Ochrobactrum sp. MYb29]|nr:hypothetical protein CQ054_05835 [Ochrobactrum sp. MYb29]